MYTRVFNQTAYMSLNGQPVLLSASIFNLLHWDMNTALAKHVFPETTCQNMYHALGRR